MAYDVCSRNGVIIPMSEALLPVTSVEVTYGFGVYENVRVRRGQPMFFSEHLARLSQSAQIIGLAHRYAAAEIDAWTRALIERCPADALNLKILLLGGRTADDATLFILPLAPLFPDRKLYRTGAHAITVMYERPFPQAKTLSMLGSYLAYRQAKEAEAYDALLVDHAGRITEGTRTNFFILRGRTIIGPPAAHVLPGVTMAHVLAVAKEHGFTVQEAELRPSDLSSADGAMLTSTSSGVMPLRSIDDHVLPISDELRALMEHYRAFVKMAEERGAE